MQRHLRRIAAWLIACVVMLWRRTCRYRVVNDPRPGLRQAGTPYVYALLHAHQAAAVFANDEHRMAAMVSRSRDGDLLVPSLALRRVTAVRGSSRRAGQNKGGREALGELAALTCAGTPCLLAVDGPKGPRGCVHRGVVDLARDTGAVVLPVVVVASKRWILRKTWDRMQMPQPLSTIRLIFGAPIAPGPDDSRHLVAEALARLEAEHDPSEALHVTQTVQNAA